MYIGTVRESIYDYTILIDVYKVVIMLSYCVEIIK